eukprot:5369766-Pyramimonas_sp.AAC.1
MVMPIAFASPPRAGKRCAVSLKGLYQVARHIVRNARAGFCGFPHAGVGVTRVTPMLFHTVGPHLGPQITIGTLFLFAHGFFGSRVSRCLVPPCMVPS